MKNYFDITTEEEIENFIKNNLLTYDEDHEERQPTEAEKASFIEESRRQMDEDPDWNLEHLAYLHADRKDFKAMVACLDKIADDMRRADTGRMLAHDRDVFDHLINTKSDEEKHD